MFKNDVFANHSVYELVDILWRGETTLDKLPPLEVVLYNANLYSMNNRRLAAFKMFQALRGDVVLHVSCVLRDHNHERFDKSFTSEVDGVGIFPNRRPDGQPNVAQHFGVPVWTPPATLDNYSKQLYCFYYYFCYHYCLLLLLQIPVAMGIAIAIAIAIRMVAAMVQKKDDGGCARPPRPWPLHENDDGGPLRD